MVTVIDGDKCFHRDSASEMFVSTYGFFPLGGMWRKLELPPPCVGMEKRVRSATNENILIFNSSVTECECLLDTANFFKIRISYSEQNGRRFSNLRKFRKSGNLYSITTQKRFCRIEHRMCVDFSNNWNSKYDEKSKNY